LLHIDPRIVITRKEGSMETRWRGQGLVEYGLIIALVAVLAIAGLLLFGPAINSMLSTVSGSV
jgi:Flp pilus assembly pilin Flp